jgi:hypothetical protein
LNALKTTNVTENRQFRPQFPYVGRNKTQKIKIADFVALKYNGAQRKRVCELGRQFQLQFFAFSNEIHRCSRAKDRSHFYHPPKKGF